MASPTLLPSAFDGMFQDFERNNLPRGRCWNMVDWIPHTLGAPATERGGWSFASAALAAGTFVAALLEAPFTAGTQLVAIDNLGNLTKIVGGVNTAIGAAVAPLQNPFMHQQLAVIPSPDGTTAPKKYDGTTIAALGGTAPAGRYGCVFVNRTWLGGAVASPQTGYASAAGDPTTYVTGGTAPASLDVGFPIKAMAALPSVMLWFGDKRTARIRGTTPPPGTDMAIDDPIFNYGTVDARSVAVNGSFVCFANAIGVFMSNGTAFPEDLTKSCGLSTYWRALMAAYTTTWTVAGGWFGSLYIVCVMNGSTLIDTIAFDTTGSKRTAYRFSNLKSLAFATAGGTGQELYAGSRATSRVMQLSTMWTPAAAFKNDGDGSAVLGTWESQYFDTQVMNTQRWRFVYAQYDQRDAAADAPTMTLSYCTSPEPGAAYTALTPTLAATTTRTPARIPIGIPNAGIGLKITRTNASALARLYSLGALVYERKKIT